MQQPLDRVISAEVSIVAAHPSWTAAKKLPVMKIGLQFVEELRHVLSLRRVSQGLAMLERAESNWAELSPSHPNATELLLLIAEWVDVGYRSYHLLDALLAKFPPNPAAGCLSRTIFAAYGGGISGPISEDIDTAIEVLDFVLRAEPGATHEHSLTLAHFWKGRAHRKKGEYELAFREIVAARELAQKFHEGAVFVSVIQIHESWLLFQKGLRKEALRLLSHAESILKATDHYLARGNIESARGRIVRRSGEYAKALEHFERAIDLYSAGTPNHRNLARALVNSAYVKRLLALQIRKRIDSRASKPSEAGTHQASTAVAGNAASLRSRYQQLCDDAISELRQAREIYEIEGHSGGLGAVMVNSGYLHLDGGDIDCAAREAVEAYRLGHEKNDSILMARARILQAATENAKIEEQLGEEIDSAMHANHAKQFSEDVNSGETHSESAIARGCSHRAWHDGGE